MKKLWNDDDAAKCNNDLLALRVYTSRLLGREPALVLHGGGNTSVKVSATNLFGESEELLYVKGSGWDLATIETAGFAPVQLDILKKMARLEQLSDSEMVRVQRAAMTHPNAPNPSVEAILHALIPFKFVDHTHADAVVTITNTDNGEDRIRQIYRDRVLIIPYVMPGFILAKKIAELTQNIDWSSLDGMILLNHGVLSFGDDAKTSYERMIDLVTAAENYLAPFSQTSGHTAAPSESQPSPSPLNGVHESTLSASEREFRRPLQRESSISSAGKDQAAKALLRLARLRKSVSAIKGGAVIAQLDTTAQSVNFANRPDVSAIATQGPLTPDHVIRTKLKPVILGDQPEKEVARYVENYGEYFERHTNGQLTRLNSAPCWAVWPGMGLVSFGRSAKEVQIISDIKDHTIKAIEMAELLGGWKALPEKDIFEMEYWELEQAKLGKKDKPLSLQGKVAMVTGAASGIGHACVEALYAQGAAVVALDFNPTVSTLFNKKEIRSILCDVTLEEDIDRAVEITIRRFGGLDILISNAGTFPLSEKIAHMNPDTWDYSLAVNLTSHQQLLKACVPYLEHGIEAAVVMIASKNVPAPGPGVSAYSVAKAGLTQLARVAALELGELKVRVNVIHPNAVFDTSIWTEEVLDKRAKHYGMTAEQYKTNNVLRTEVTSQDVAALACAMAGPLFAKTTGAQVPVDGGNDRVI